MSTPDANLNHPLDPLSAEEIERAVSIVRASGGLDPSTWFETIALDEPSKDELVQDSCARRAFVTCYDPASGHVYDGTIDLQSGSLERWDHRAGAQARIVLDESLWAAQVVIEDAEVQAGLAGRGITDFDKVLIEAWSMGNFGFDDEDGERLAYCYCWL